MLIIGLFAERVLILNDMQNYIVVEEADETQFWLEILVESDLIKIEEVLDIRQEVEEIVKVMTTYKYRSEKNSTQ